MLRWQLKQETHLTKSPKNLILSKTDNLIGCQREMPEKDNFCQISFWQKYDKLMIFKPFEYKHEIIFNLWHYKISTE